MDSVEFDKSSSTKSNVKYEGVITRKRAALISVNNIASIRINDNNIKDKATKNSEEKENVLECLENLNETEYENLRKECFVWPCCNELQDPKVLRDTFQILLRRKEIIRCHYTKCTQSETPIWFTTDNNDEFMHYEYLPVIVDHIIETEQFYKPLGRNFLENSLDINYRHRYTLINWMVELHEVLSLSNEALQLSIGIMDRFIKSGKDSLKREDLLIIGVMCLFIAGKVEDVYSYSLSDIIVEAKINYDLGKCRMLEEKILSAIDFKLSIPLPLSFIRHYNILFKAETITNLYSRYFCELSLHDYIASGYNSNMIGSSCVFLAQVIQQKRTVDFEEVWSPELQCSSGLLYEDFQDMVKNLCIIVSKQLTASKYRAITTKYSVDRYMKVSKTAVHTVGFKHLLEHFKSTLGCPSSK